jgi:hypothetical protein
MIIVRPRIPLIYLQSVQDCNYEITLSDPQRTVTSANETTNAPVTCREQALYFNKCVHAVPHWYLLHTEFWGHVPVRYLAAATNTSVSLICRHKASRRSVQWLRRPLSMTRKCRAFRSSARTWPASGVNSWHLCPPPFSCLRDYSERKQTV